MAENTNQIHLSIDHVYVLIEALRHMQDDAYQIIRHLGILRIGALDDKLIDEAISFCQATDKKSEELAKAILEVCYESPYFIKEKREELKRQYKKEDIDYLGML